MVAADVVGAVGGQEREGAGDGDLEVVVAEGDRDEAGDYRCGCGESCASQCLAGAVVFVAAIRLLSGPDLVPPVTLASTGCALDELGCEDREHSCSPQDEDPRVVGEFCIVVCCCVVGGHQSVRPCGWLGFCLTSWTLAPGSAGVDVGEGFSDLCDAA